MMKYFCSYLCELNKRRFKGRLAQCRQSVFPENLIPHCVDWRVPFRFVHKFWEMYDFMIHRFSYWRATQDQGATCGELKQSASWGNNKQSGRSDAALEEIIRQNELYKMYKNGLFTGKKINRFTVNTAGD